MGELPEPVRRRLDEIFGDVLPAVTQDERDDQDRSEAEHAGERDLLADRPPHHDRER
jgi:hypothetical protein